MASILPESILVFIHQFFHRYISNTIISADLEISALLDLQQKRFIISSRHNFGFGANKNASRVSKKLPPMSVRQRIGNTYQSCRKTQFRWQ
jgi:hypothetical protein